MAWQGSLMVLTAWSRTRSAPRSSSRTLKRLPKICPSSRTKYVLHCIRIGRCVYSIDLRDARAGGAAFGETDRPKTLLSTPVIG